MRAANIKTKVVINTCHGGFNLSPFAQDLWETRTGEEWDAYTVPRHDPTLVQIVEEYGEAKTAGECSQLCVQKIRGSRYIIRDYDGWEQVETPDTIDWTDADPTPEPDSRKANTYLSRKVWPHKRNVIVQRLEALCERFSESWQPGLPESRSHISNIITNDVYMDAAAVANYALMTLPTCEPDTLASMLTKDMRKMYDADHWLSVHNAGYTDHLMQTAGSALAFALSIPISTVVQDMDCDVLDILVEATQPNDQ